MGAGRRRPATYDTRRLTRNEDGMIHMKDSLCSKAKISPANEISTLVVSDDEQSIVGVLHLKDLLHAGIA